ILDETFKTNLAEGRADKSLTDKKLDSFITLQDGKPYELDFKKKTTFDRVSLQENIAEGQRNKEALLEYWDGKSWKEITRFTTIGYKRLLRIPTIKTNKIRITVLDSLQPVQLAEVGVYKASAKEK